MIPYYVAINEMSDVMSSEFDCLCVLIHYQYTIKAYASIFSGNHSNTLRVISRLLESDNIVRVNSKIPTYVNLILILILGYALPCYEQWRCVSIVSGAGHGLLDQLRLLLRIRDRIGILTASLYYRVSYFPLLLHRNFNLFDYLTLRSQITFMFFVC